ncbi:MAG: diguanylate cyclase [Rhodospirillales bacterium]
MNGAIGLAVIAALALLLGFMKTSIETFDRVATEDYEAVIRIADIQRQAEALYAIAAQALLAQDAFVLETQSDRLADRYDTLQQTLQTMRVPDGVDRSRASVRERLAAQNITLQGVFDNARIMVIARNRLVFAIENLNEILIDQADESSPRSHQVSEFLGSVTAQLFPVVLAEQRLDMGVSASLQRTCKVTIRPLEDGPKACAALDEALRAATEFGTAGDGARNLLLRVTQQNSLLASELDRLFAAARSHLNGSSEQTRQGFEALIWLLALALGLMLPLIYLTHHLADRLIFNRLTRMRQSMAAWLQRREPLPDAQMTDEIGQLNGFIQNFVDEIERREECLGKAAAEIEQSRNVMLSVFQISSAALLIVDRDTLTVEDANPAAQALIKRLGGDSPSDSSIAWERRPDRAPAFLAEEPWATALERVDRGTSAEGLEACVEGRDGEDYWFQIAAHSLARAGKAQVLLVASDITRQKQREQVLAKAATRDALTGLYNRRGFTERAERTFKQLQATGEPASFLMIDIDHFKSINDTFGHAAGDLALCHISEKLLDGLRESDILGRIGGEEFGILLPGIGADRAAQLGERLRRAVETSALDLPGRAIVRMTVSLGLAEAKMGRDLAHLMEDADKALYRAKDDGRNRLALFAT